MYASFGGRFVKGGSVEGNEDCPLLLGERSWAYIEVLCVTEMSRWRRCACDKASCTRMVQVLKNVRML